MIISAVRKSLINNLLDAGAVAIRDVPKNVTNDQVEGLPLDKQPLKYSTGNWGCMYANVKAQVGNKKLFRRLMHYLAVEVAERCPNLKFVSGNATGGIIPGWTLSEYLEPLLGREVPNVYMRDTRKAGGHKELITGLKDNPLIKPGDEVLVVEELTNYAETTINAVKVFRREGFTCYGGACILAYDHLEANAALKANTVELVCLFTMSNVLNVAQERQTFPNRVLDECHRWLANPTKWQADRGLIPDPKGGTR